MLGVMAEPFKVDAIAGIDDAIYFALATVCLSMGIGIAVNNPNSGAIIYDLWNSFSGKVQDYFYNMSLQAGVAYSFVFEWVPEQWGTITSEILDYFNNHHSVTSSPYMYCTPGTSGKLGFTEDTVFSFTIPQDLKLNEMGVVLLQKGKLSFGVLDVETGKACYPEIFVNPSCPYNCIVRSLETYDGFKWVEVSHGYSANPSCFYAGTITSRVAKDYSPRNGLHFQGSYFNRVLSIQNDDNNSNCFYDSSGNSYYLGLNENGKYSFMSVFSNFKYLNLEFNSIEEAILWFLDECGLVADFGNGLVNNDSVGVYDPSVPSDGITYDPDKTRQKLDELDGIIDATGSLPTVIPGNLEDLGVLADNPALVTDPTAAGELLNIYPADLPQINAPSNLWTDKFPFCLPFDIYNLFAGFSAAPEIPEFHILVLPENSFGLKNEEIYFDVDFEPYDKLVKIFRFFICAGFVVFLILITRKLIGS